MPVWSTACLDWEQRILDGRSLVPFDPLFPEEAAAAFAVFNTLPIVDSIKRETFGESARAFVRDFVGAIFGSYDNETGQRLINYFFFLISKKNGKSTTAAGIMATALILNWRELGEFYILAPTKEIAENSFAPAAGLTRRHPTLNEILKISAGRVIEHRRTGAFLKVVAADQETVAGKKTIGLFVDELHLFGKNSRAEGMLLEAEGGLAARPEGFVIYSSTQSDAPPAGVFKSKLEEFRGIRDGKIIAPNKLPIIYEFPKSLLEGEKFRDPKYWGITNPNLGASVFESFLQMKLAEADRSGPAAKAIFYSKYLNVQIGQNMRAEGWAGAQIWRLGADPGLTLDVLLDRSDVVTVGIDAGGGDDFVGLAVLGRDAETGDYLAWVHAFASTVAVWRRKANAELYRQFKAQGHLTIFRFKLSAQAFDETDPAIADLIADVPPPDPHPEALPTDIQYIVDVICRIRDRGLLGKVGADPAMMKPILTALERVDITPENELITGVRQGWALGAPLDVIYRMLQDGAFRHGDQPLLNWCVGNVIIVPTSTSKRPERESASLDKIDPFIALLNATELMSPELQPQASVYTPERGLIVFG